MTSAAEYARRLGLQPALEQLGVPHHARQRLVELVRGRPRELGDDRLSLLREDLLLRLREALLHPHLFAQVGEDADGPDRRVALVEHARPTATRVRARRSTSSTSVRRPFDAPAARRG